MTLHEVIKIIQAYQDAHWKQAGVNETCSELKRLLAEKYEAVPE
jgi:hypothetical protein